MQRGRRRPPRSKVAFQENLTVFLEHCDQITCSLCVHVLALVRLNVCRNVFCLFPSVYGRLLNSHFSVWIYWFSGKAETSFHLCVQNVRRLISPRLTWSPHYYLLRHITPQFAKLLHNTPNMPGGPWVAMWAREATPHVLLPLQNISQN